MRRYIPLGFVVFAGLLIPSSASATRFCDVATNPCPAAKILATGLTVKGDLAGGTNVVILTTGGALNPSITCSASKIGFVTTNAGGGAGTNVAANLTELTLGSCISANPAGCTVGTITGLATMGSSFAWTGGTDGTASAVLPTIPFQCTVMGNPVNCVSTGSTIAGVFTGSRGGADPPDITFTNSPITTGGDFGCPAMANVTADYRVTTPGLAWLSNS